MGLLRKAVFACLVVGAAATEATGTLKSASFVQANVTDTWCHNHFFGSGAATCVSMNGCCYSDLVGELFDNTQELGACHSCVAHEDKWCQTYGDKDLESCLKLGGGCQYNVTSKRCNSVRPELPKFQTCEEYADDEGAMTIYEDCMDSIDEEFGNEREGEGRDAEGNEIWKLPVSTGGCAELYHYTPQCTADSDGQVFEASQADTDGVGPDTYFCVDMQGHEIPDTRKNAPLSSFYLDCEKLRKMHAGMQCPNAITLSTEGGVTFANKDNEASNCDKHCNTDADCPGEGWCCHNGCGHMCHDPIKPLSSCSDVPTDIFQTVLWASGWANEWGCPPGKGGKDCSKSIEEEHGTQVLLSCMDGFDATPIKSAPQNIALRCHHGHWETMDGSRDFVSNLVCNKACEPYAIHGKSSIDDRDLKARDFQLHMNGVAHGSIANVSCAEEYGAITGSNEVMRNLYEILTCEQGVWITSAGGEQTLECSVCYDKQDFEWRDANDHPCHYFASRPMECNDNDGALANCRVSCRTCLEAEEKYKVKRTVKTISDVQDDQKQNWHRVRKKKGVKKTRKAIKNVATKVTTRLLPSEVCANNEGSKLRKPEAGCPEGYEVMG